MARSSVRLQAKQINRTGTLEHLDEPVSDRKPVRNEDSDDEYEEHDQKRAKVPESSRKRAPQKKSKGAVDKKTNTRKVPVDRSFKKVRGKLGFLDKVVTEVPLEVIFEVFSYLNPVDILYLARTSTELRNMLMSKSSEPIWRAARSNIENLPPLPQDLNEPQYANLMFEPHRHVCLSKSRCENVVWEYRMRCCRKCEYELFDNLESRTPEPFQQIRALVPSNFVGPEGPRECVRGIVYMAFVVEQYISEYEATEDDAEKRAQWIEERTRNKNRIMPCFAKRGMKCN